MTEDPHTHEVGRRRQGPSVDDHIRCVSCGSSTRGRRYERCTLSNSDGGRICTKCIKSNPNRALECNLWVPHSRQSYCHHCTAPRDDLLNCFCCDKDVCANCVEPLTMAFFGPPGHFTCYATVAAPRTYTHAPQHKKNPHRGAFHSFSVPYARTGI